MSHLRDYQHSYRNISFKRQDGIIEIRLHSEEGSLKWGALKGSVHEQLGDAFHDVGRDEENRVVILTGTGATFCAEMNMAELPDASDTGYWHRISREGRALLMNLMDIPVPVIAAVNGPATIHAELAVLSDIVLAAESAVFADDHFTWGTVPGDGAHVVWPMMLGPNRGRYFLLTGERITAAEAQTLGVVNEVLSDDEQLMERAWQLADQFASKPVEVLRYTRTALTQSIKRELLSELGHGLAVEGLALG